MHASDLIQHEDTSGTTRETSHQCCIMRKAMSKEVGAGGRFDIFLDSGVLQWSSSLTPRKVVCFGYQSYY